MPTNSTPPDQTPREARREATAAYTIGTLLALYEDDITPEQSELVYAIIRAALNMALADNRQARGQS